MSRIAWWKLDDSGATLADSQGSLDLTATGSTEISGVFSGARAFNADNEFLSVGSNALLQFGARNFTISAWVYLNEQVTGTQARYLVHKWGSSANEYRLYVGPSAGSIIQFQVSEDGTSTTTVLTSNPHHINDFRWHHVAVTKSGTDYVLYVDGIAVDSDTGPLTLHTGAQDFNVFYNEDADAVQGGVDNIEIFDHAKTAQEIKAIVYDVEIVTPATFASESIKYQNAYRWLVELTDGSTILRYSHFDMPILSTGMCEGRVMSVGDVTRKLSERIDNTGPQLTLFDPDGAIESYGITRGWTATFKAGYEDLAFTSWETVGTFEVAYKPERNFRAIAIQLVSKGISSLGLMTNIPKIEADDAYIFSSLSTTSDRVGERFPMYFGVHQKDDGAVPLRYLGFDKSLPGMVFVVNAQHASADSTGITRVFVDGKQINSYTAEMNTTGNYKLTLIKLTTEQLSSFGIVDEKTSKAMRRYINPPRVVRPDLLRGQAGNLRLNRQISQDGRPVRKLTANIEGPYEAPTELIEHLFEYHGGGLALRDSASYSATSVQLSKFAAASSLAIEQETFLEEAINTICEDYGLKQYWTVNGLHGLYYHLDATATESHSSFSSSLQLGDLNYYIEESKFVSSDSGSRAPINSVQIETTSGPETITDSTAVTAYGTVMERLNQSTVRADSSKRMLAWNKIQRNKTPRVTATVGMSAYGLNLELGDVVRSTIRSAPEQSGWTDKLTTVEAMSWSPVGASVSLVLTDRSQNESATSAYVDTEDDWSIVDITDGDVTSGDAHFTSTDAALADVQAGDLIWYKGSDLGNCSRISRISESAGTYTVRVSNKFDITDASASIQFFNTANNGSFARVGGADNLTVNASVRDYLSPAADDWVFAWPLWEAEQIGQQSAGTQASANMTINGTLAYSSAGQFGNAPNFDGSTTYLTNANTPAPFASAVLTICVWVNPTSLAADGVIVSRGGAAGGASADNKNYELLILTDGTIKLVWEHGLGVEETASSSAGAVVAGVLQFVAVTRASDGVCNFYTATNSDSSVSLIWTTSANDVQDGGADGTFAIAASARGAADKFNGIIQGVCINNTEQSEANINILFSDSVREAASKVY